MFRIFSVVVVILLMLGVVACQGPAGPAGPPGPAGAQGPAGPAAVTPSAAKIIVVPMEGKNGSKVTVYGSGFKKGEMVKVVISPEPGLSISWAENEGPITANDYGAFILKPPGGVPTADVIKPGVYTVRAEGAMGSTTTAPFVVLPPK